MIGPDVTQKFVNFVNSLLRLCLGSFCIQFESLLYNENAGGKNAVTVCKKTGDEPLVLVQANNFDDELDDDGLEEEVGAVAPPARFMDIARSSPSNRSSKQKLVIVICLVLALVAITARVIPGPRNVDDSFITFRYSRNIVEGEGFVYNPGVRTLGTTTPLFTLLMAGMSTVAGGQEFPWYALTVSALADAATVIFLYLITRRLTGNDWAGIVPALLWAVAPRSVAFAVGGMETSVNILWMVGAFWLYITAESTRWKPILLGVFVGVGVLTRIDALLWIGPLLLFQLVESWRSAKRIPWRTWLAAVITVAPWFIFSAVYFGSPLPNSLSAKTVAYQMPPGTAFVTFLQVYGAPFFEHETFGGFFIAVGGLVYLVLTLLGILYTARHMPRLLPLLLYPWLYMIVFSVANPLIFRWYLTPPLPGLMLGIIAGLWSLVGGHERAPRWLAPAVVGLFGLFWFGTSLNAWTLHPDHGQDRPAPKMAWNQIELYYEQIGTELRTAYGVTSETKVASADIGAIGYFSRATIVDTVGLVTPAMRAYYPTPPELIVEGQNYAIPPEIILDTLPDFLVTMEAFVRLGLEQTPAFTSQYELLEEIPTDFYGSGMRLYGRRAS